MVERPLRVGPLQVPPLPLHRRGAGDPKPPVRSARTTRSPDQQKETKKKRGKSIAGSATARRRDDEPPTPSAAAAKKRSAANRDASSSGAEPELWRETRGSARVAQSSWAATGRRLGRATATARERWRSAGGCGCGGPAFRLWAPVCLCFRPAYEGSVDRARR